LSADRVSLTADHAARLMAGAADAEQPHGLLAAVDEVACELLGHALFTAMRFHEAAMEVERVYSSDARAYPLGGRKPKRDTAWGRHVLIERRIFVGEGEAAIRDAFADHELILGLGLRSVANVPVVFAGRCLGAVNFLWQAASVRLVDIAAARVLALVATPALLAA
jgi:hypothetical protein